MTCSFLNGEIISTSLRTGQSLLNSNLPVLINRQRVFKDDITDGDLVQKSSGMNYSVKIEQEILNISNLLGIDGILPTDHTILDTATDYDIEDYDDYFEDYEINHHTLLGRHEMLNGVILDDTTPLNMEEVDDFVQDIDNTRRIQKQGFECPPGYSFHPDPDGNCSVFIVCRDGKAHKQVCGEGRLHFNTLTKLCDYPSRTFCSHKCQPNNTTSPVPGFCDLYLDCRNNQGRYIRCPSGLHYNAVTKQCDSPQRALCEVPCPKYDTLVPLPGRCKMYASCMEGVATYYHCPFDLHFDSLLLTCTEPQTTDCEMQCMSPDGYFPILGQCSNYIQCKGGRARVFTCPSGLHFDFLLHSCDIPSKAGCSPKCEKPNGFFPYPRVCSLYIRCIDGFATVRKCPGQLKFNALMGQCDDLKKNQCWPSCPADNGIFPIPDKCELYIRCSDGNGVLRKCPPNMHFNALFKHCDLPERALCQLKCPHAYGLFPLPGRCNQYLRCENNTGTLQSCSEELHFNAYTSICDWSDSALCEDLCPEPEGIFPVKGDCNTYVKCSGGKSTLGKCSTGKHFNFYSARCEDGKTCDYVCPAKNEIFPLPRYCDSYLLCRDGLPYVNNCPTGLFFNAVTATCDIPENVDCDLWKS